MQCIRVQYIYSVQQDKAFTRLNITRQQSSCMPPFGLVQNTYRTRTVQYQRIYVCILFSKIMLNRILMVIFWPICELLKQIINQNRSKFVLSKLVLSGICCKHFMYTCMHRLCTLYCVHVECQRPKFRHYSSKILMPHFLISQKFG